MRKTWPRHPSQPPLLKSPLISQESPANALSFWSPMAKRLVTAIQRWPSANCVRSVPMCVSTSSDTPSMKPPFERRLQAGQPLEAANTSMHPMPSNCPKRCAKPWRSHLRSMPETHCWPQVSLEPPDSHCQVETIRSVSDAMARSRRKRSPSPRNQSST